MPDRPHRSGSVHTGRVRQDGDVTPLDSQEIDLLKRWVAGGAKWGKHWAFVAPARPELPKVSDEKWCRNAIDRFLLARLDSEGLKPSPETSKEKLLRRVTLDLTGLPPTPAEIDAFIAELAG